MNHSGKEKKSVCWLSFLKRKKYLLTVPFEEKSFDLFKEEKSVDCPF